MNNAHHRPSDAPGILRPLLEIMKTAQVDDQVRKLAWPERIGVEDPLMKIGIGQRQQPLEAIELLAFEARQYRRRISPQQPVHFLGAAMARPVSRAPAAQ